MSKIISELIDIETSKFIKKQLELLGLYRELSSIFGEHENHDLLIIKPELSSNPRMLEVYKKIQELERIK